MTDTDRDAALVPCEPDVDASGVDLAQIRAMLDLEPAQRLAWVTEFMNSLIATRAPNGTRSSG